MNIFGLKYFAVLTKYAFLYAKIFKVVKVDLYDIILILHKTKID